MKIAIVAADTLPIPASKGGATETLMTHLIRMNSLEGKHEFIIYSYWDAKAESLSKEIKHTQFVYYRPTSLKKLIDSTSFFITRVFRRISNGLFRVHYGFVHYACEDIKKKKVDLVLFEGNCMHIRQGSAELREPVVLHLHSDTLNEDIPIDRFRIIKKTRCLITVSEFEKKRIDSLSKGEKKIFVLRNIIDNKLFDNRRFSEIVINEKRKMLGFKNDDFVLIYCGRVVEQKGVLELVRAMKQLPHYIKLMVVGSSWFSDNKETPFIQKLKNESAVLGDRIVFTGYVNQLNLPLFYSLSDLAVFPSRYNETAGLVVLEALSCGIPVVSPNFGGMYEFSPKESSYYIDTKNNCEKNIVETINYLTRNKTEYYEKKSKARESVLQNSPSCYYASFCNIVEEIKGL